MPSDRTFYHSRNVRDYIDLDNHILMDFDKETCSSSNSESKRFTKNIPIQDWKKKNRVLIMQHSAVTNFDDRQENRETWMQSLKVRFILITSTSYS